MLLGMHQPASMLNEEVAPTLRIGFLDCPRILKLYLTTGRQTLRR